METSRRILNIIFWIAVSIGLVWAFIMILGGGFPVALNTIEAQIRFDVSKWGWASKQLDNGLMTIDHEKADVKEGWGCLQFDYKFNSKKPPAVYSDKYGFEGLRRISFWLRSKNPCIIGVRLDDKKNQYNFMVPIAVDSKWRKTMLAPADFKHAVGMKERLETTRFGGYIEFRDITPSPRTKENTLWVDTIVINR